MSNFLEKGDKVVEGVILIGCMPSFITLIVIIALFRSFMGYGEIDIDNSYMIRRYLYDRAYVTDSTGNGYEVLWYTTNAVTDLRYDEIKSRKHIRDSYKKFKKEAGVHFNHNLINTNIYDFVKYAKTFDVDSMDVRLVNVWVYGAEYEKLYRRPHKDYPDGWGKYDNMEFGTLFLKEYEIYPYNFEAPRKYRYWECDATSLTDERYTHITEADRKTSN